MTNTYDKTDRVERLGVLIAGPLKIACYRVRDPQTDEWSPRQFHMTVNNMILGVMGEEAAKLFARFVNSELHPGKFPAMPTRVTLASPDEEPTT